MSIRTREPHALPSGGEAGSILLRTSQVQRATGLSRSSLHRLVKADRFPRPLALTRYARAWRWRDVLAWLESREERATA
jgi:prophage regulatory protein